MIDLNKDYTRNTKELDKLLSKDIKNEEDLKNIRMSITYLYKQIIQQDNIDNIGRLNAYIQYFKKKEEESKITLSEKSENDLTEYRYNEPVTATKVKKDSVRDTYFYNSLMLIFLSFVAGVSFINIDVAFAILIVQFLYTGCVILYVVTGKRLFPLNVLKMLAIMGVSERKQRDSAYEQALRHIYKDDSDVVTALNKPKREIRKCYITELVREKYIEVKEK